MFWLLAVLAYLLGSLSGSLLLGRLRGVDIRQHGSGNAGGTNALRTQGWKFALGTVVVDVGKGVLAVWLMGALQLVVTIVAQTGGDALGQFAVIRSQLDQPVVLLGRQLHAFDLAVWSILRYTQPENTRLTAATACKTPSSTF